MAAVVVILCLAFGKARRPTMDRADQSEAHMIAAIDFIQTKVAPSDILYTDYQTELVLGRYLCHAGRIEPEPAPPMFEQFSCGNRRVVSRDYRGWMFSADNFMQEWQRLVGTYALTPGTRVWIVQARWGATLPEDLKREPQFQNLQFQAFGNNIKIFQIVVGKGVPEGASNGD